MLHWTGSGRGPGLYQQQTADHGEEAGAVGKEGGRHSPQGDKPGGDGRADYARAVEGRLVERDRLGQVFRFDELRIERLVRRQVVGSGEAEQERYQPDVPEAETMYLDQHTQQHGEHGHHRLCNQQDPAPLHPVRSNPSERHQDQHRDRGREIDGRQSECGPGQRGDDPALGELLHPGPGL